MDFDRKTGEPPETALPAAVPAWLASLGALALGLALTLGLAAWQRHRDSIDESRQLEALARSQADVLARQLREYDLAVRALQSSFQAGAPDEAAFARAYDALALSDRLPGLQAVVFSRRVPGPDGDHFLTDLVQPRAGNERVLGLDVRSQPHNLAAVLRSG
jgi:CHASE1-domain containing sensor protein